MSNAISSILRAATRKPTSRLNVASAPTHERYQSMQAKTGHDFYFIQHHTFVRWNKSYAPIPDNVVILNGENLPSDVDFDVVLAHHKHSQVQVLSPIVRRLGIPLIFLEHTLPPKEWPKSHLQQLSK